MPQEQLFRLGAEVRCADGDCGRVKSLVVNRDDDAVTHLVVEPAHRRELGKLVPLGLVDTGAAAGDSEVRLHCTKAEFGQLDSAEAPYFPGDEDYEKSGRWEPAVAWPYYAPPGSLLPDAPAAPDDPVKLGQLVTVDTVEDELPGEDEVSRGEHVHATDGDVGHVLGIVVDTGSGRVTSVLLREGHLLGSRTVLIPRSAVTRVDADGFHLNIAREQAQSLPAASP